MLCAQYWRAFLRSLLKIEILRYRVQATRLYAKYDEKCYSCFLRKIQFFHNSNQIFDTFFCDFLLSV